MQMTPRPFVATVRSLPTGDDVLWPAVREEAEAVLRASPELGGLVVPTVFHATSVEDAAARRVSGRLAGPSLPDRLLYDAFSEAFAADPAIGQAVRADLRAVLDRDPATTRAIEPLLYFKGFHAIQTHRLAHWLWRSGRRDFALYLQSRSSEVFQTDIHPAVPMGEGIFLDHATGLVVGATAVIEDHVSILQGVTLGGTGKQTGDRHPKIRRGVLIGAGAKILGNIEIGRCARVAAGSVVLRPVPANTTVAGVPARPVGPAGCPDPASAMDQTLDRDAYDAFDYVI
ncbi:serine O-acetyltransferase [Blastochloris viridis]|nr:Serine acetyltransferase [Blastochloris viridis]CUU42553.1 Serine acetyltransferase [Blastochloris viridis]